MIWGILLVARYTFSLTGYPKIAYIQAAIWVEISQKIWQIPIPYGKNFKCCFSDVFKVAESESEVHLALKILVLPILGFVNFDCPQLYVCSKTLGWVTTILIGLAQYGKSGLLVGNSILRRTTKGMPNIADFPSPVTIYSLHQVSIQATSSSCQR